MNSPTGCGGSPSRDPDEYRHTEHYQEDAKPDAMRFFTESMVRETIREGEDCDRVAAGPGRLRRRKTFDGVDVVLVLPEYTPEIITGWTEVSDFTTALESSRWSQEQIRTIQAFQNYEHMELDENPAEHR